MYDFSFVPPVVQQYFTLSKHDQKVFGKYACSWWEDHSIIKYPSCLISYKYALDSPNSYNNVRKNYRIPDDVEVFVDSGAFTAVSRKIVLDPKNVFNWQERNGDVAFILDVIPADVEIASTVGRQVVKHYGFEEFKKNAQETYKNCEIFFNLRKNKHPKIYAITHGIPIRNLITNELEEMYEYWYDILKDFPFDGWATGFKPVHNPLLQAVALMKLYDKGHRENIHLLGVAAAKTIPVMIWAKRYIKNITFDGTRYGHGAMTRMYFYPENITDFKFWGDKKFRQPGKGISWDYESGKVNCKCKVCEIVKENVGNLLFYNSSGSFPGALIGLHNILVHENLVNGYEKRKHDYKEFIAFLQQHTKKQSFKEAKSAIDFIEDCISNGFDNTYNRYLSAGYDFGLKQEPVFGGLEIW
jgi:hypothetical protein